MLDRERRMLDELLDLEDGLTEWELQFVNDLDTRDRNNEDFHLSLKQADLLSQVHERRAE